VLIFEKKKTRAAKNLFGFLEKKQEKTTKSQKLRYLQTKKKE